MGNAFSNDKNFLFYNSGVTVEDFKIDKRQVDFDAIFENIETMDSNSVLFNNYNNTETVGNINAKYFNMYADTSGAEFTIYRKTIGQTYYDFICDLNNGAYQIKDFNIVNHEKYHYLVSVKTQVDAEADIYEYYFYENTEGEDNYYAIAEWPFWSITDIDYSEDEDIYYQSGSVWKLAYNMEAGDYTYNTNIMNWDTLGQFGKVSQGRKNFYSSTMRCLLGEITEYAQEDADGNIKKIFGYTEKTKLLKSQEYSKEDGKCLEVDWAGKAVPYSREVDKMQAWKAFITNGSLKLLKDYKGNSWIVAITNASASNNLQTNEQITTISFDWQEVEDIKKARIVNMGE